MKIRLNNQNVFFTSDLHFGHKNMVRALSSWSDLENSTRDFKSVEEMNKKIIDNINSVVGLNDFLFILGDVAFGNDSQLDCLQDINCKNLYLVFGNHDGKIRNNVNFVQHRFISMDEIINLTVDKHNFVLFHYPMVEWEGFHKGHIHLYGHVHSNAKNKLGIGKSMDVGVDGNNFMPYSINDILKFLQENGR